MLTAFTFGLIVVALLTAYLCVRVSLRHWGIARAEKARLRAIERKYPPKAFDTSAIAPQVRRVCQNHAASSHSCWRSFHHRAELVAAARRLVTGMAYFR
jgi:hypothetical protein